MCRTLISLPSVSCSHSNFSEDIEKAHWKYSWVGDIVYSVLVHMRFDSRPKDFFSQFSFPLEWHLHTTGDLLVFFKTTKIHINIIPFIFDVSFLLSCCRECREESAVKKQGKILQSQKYGGTPEQELPLISNWSLVMSAVRERLLLLHVNNLKTDLAVLCQTIFSSNFNKSLPACYALRNWNLHSFTETGQGYNLCTYNYSN